MTAVTGRGVPPKFASEEAIPRRLRRGLAAAVAPFKNWFMGQNSSGVAVAQAAGVTGLIPLGVTDRDEVAGTTDGAAEMVFDQRMVSGFPNSTLANDAILNTDFAVPAYAVDNQTIGKLSVVAGVSRNLLGLAFGIDPDNGTPWVWSNPFAWLLARVALLADAAAGGFLVKVVDAGAATDTVNGLAEAIVPREKLAGTITAVEFSVEGATLAASGTTDFTTLTLFKRDGAGGAAVAVATITTKTIAFTQWTTVSFTLSVVAGATSILATDILTLVKTHGGSGAIVPSGQVRPILKVS
jgi:hypothetical protein